MTSQSEIALREVEVRSVDYQVVVEVRRSKSCHPELVLQLREVEGVGYVVGCGITSLLYAKLLGCLPSTDYQIRSIERRRVREMPTTPCPPVVASIIQEGSHREVAAGVRSER